MGTNHDSLNSIVQEEGLAMRAWLQSLVPRREDTLMVFGCSGETTSSSPFHHIFWAYLLEGEDLDRTCEEVDTLVFCERKRSQYTDFVQTHLLQRVPLDASTSRVSV